MKTSATITIPGVGIEYPISDLHQVDQSNFQKLIDGFDAKEQAGIICIDEDLNIEENLHIPIGLVLRFTNNKKITVSEGASLTISDRVVHGNTQIFAGDGEVTLLENKETNVRWFGAKGDGSQDENPFYQKAKKSISSGVIYFPAGEYVSTTGGFGVLKNNMVLKGDGIGVTILRTADDENQGGAALSLSVYRDGGMTFRDENRVWTFENKIEPGQNYIDLKAGNYNLELLTKGAVVFLNAGASYFDQMYGEFNIIEKVRGNRVYFRYNWSRNYAWQFSNDNSETQLIQDFQPPAVGQTAIAHFSGPIPSEVFERFISFQNETFYIVDIDHGAGTAILKNMGKGTSTALIPAGTKLYKKRLLWLCPESTYNTEIKDMTLSGYRTGIALSNCVKTRFYNCRIEKLSYSNSGEGNDGGIWVDGDDGRDVTFDSCEIYADKITGSQFARSFGDIRFRNCHIQNVAIEFSEFNFNGLISKCDYHFGVTDGGEKVEGAINIGWTCSNIQIKDCNLYGSNVRAMIRRSDILFYTNTSSVGLDIINNNFFLDDCYHAVSLNGASGYSNIIGNRIIGNVDQIFGGSSADIFLPDNRFGDMGGFAYGNRLTIKNNYFAGRCYALFYNTNYINTTVEDNVFHNYLQEGPGSPYGNIIYTANDAETATPAQRFTMRNNDFINWIFYEHSFDFRRPLDVTVDISNNFFQSQRNPAYPTNFVHSLTSPQTDAGNADNQTANELSNNELNQAYPAARVNMKVFCANINLVYEKKTFTSWVSYPYAAAS